MGFNFNLVIILKIFDGFERCISLLLILLFWEPFEAV